MGNSRVLRIHAGHDLAEVYGMARRLLPLAVSDCGCPSHVDADVHTRTHDRLERYLPVDGASLTLDIPAGLLPHVVAELTPHLSRDERATVRRNGDAWLSADLTPAIVDALRQLPDLAVEVHAPERDLPSELPDQFLALVGGDRGSVAWSVCWPGNHGRSGFELAVNGAELWHRESPPGHSLYVHVHPFRLEQADELAAAVGGQVVGHSALGW